MENRLKTLVTGLLAILLTAVLFVLAFLGRNSALKAKEEKEEALKTASAYAEALAESAASMPAPVVPEEPSEKDSSEKKPDTASYSDEAGLFAAFTANDTEIRDSLAALEQDDPELIKNYRIRVSLPKMETVDLPDGEWRRVRFSGKFEKKGKRDFAVIRINGDSGSFKGRILLSDIRFDDDKKLSLSGMSDEDVSTSFGAALRETGISSLKGEPCVSAVSEFTGDSELDRIALRIPLNDMDSSEFSTVKYDLYFEGTDSDLSFTTGCDFAGKASVDEELDKVNRAFVLYRGAAAAGQNPEENRSALLSGIEGMKNELKAWPDTDPLVIKVNDLLDKKTALAGGEPAEAAEDSDEETEDKEKEEKKGENAPAAVTPSYPVPSSDEVKTVPLVLIILTAVLLLAALIILMLSSGKETEEEEPEEKGTAYLALKEAEEEKAELNKELLNARNEKEELEARLSDTEMKVASAADFDAEEAIIDEIKEKTADLISSDSEKSDGKEREKELLNSVDAVRSSLSGLSENNTALNDSLKGIDTYLSETGDSVKSINSAADFISRIASETNLLALNASIEAARAGEAGRGFAVVADEISKLADETEKSVSEITDTVNKLNSDFDETGKHMDGILKLASDQGESIDEALKAFDETEGRIRSGSPDTAKEDLKRRKQAADEIVKLTDQLRTKLDYKRKELR